MRPGFAAVLIPLACCAHSRPTAAPRAPLAEVRLPICPLGAAEPIVQFEERKDGGSLLFVAKSEAVADELRRQVALIAELHNRSIGRANRLVPPKEASPEDATAFDWLSGISANPVGFGGTGGPPPIPAPLPSSPGEKPTPSGPPWAAASRLQPMPPSTATWLPAEVGSRPGARLNFVARSSEDVEKLASALDERAMALGTGWCLLLPLGDMP